MPKEAYQAMLMRSDRPANSLTNHCTHKTTKKIVAIGPVPNAAELTELFRARGWETVAGLNGKETRKLAIKVGASLVVIPARGEPETGWMSCLKLVRTGKKRRVILIGDLGDHEAERFAQFAGATAYLTAEDGVDAIWDAGTMIQTTPIHS